jgi:Predicted exporters of the RND superfamily
MTSGKDGRTTPGASASGEHGRWEQLAGEIVRRPWRAVLLALLVFVAFGLGLRGLEKDPSVDAFVPDDHPAALARDRAAELFGLEDPIVVGLSTLDGGSVFTPEALTALREISEAARTIPGVKKNDIVSLATENAISGQDGDLAIDPVLPAGPIDDAAAALAWSRVQSMPMMLDLLAARDGSLVTILIPGGGSRPRRSPGRGCKGAGDRPRSRHAEGQHCRCGHDECRAGRGGHW